MSTEIHPTAVIDPNARLGLDVRVGPYAIIEHDCVIGDSTRIDSFGQIKAHTTLGSNNHVHSYACLGGTPQDLKYRGGNTRLEIGDGNCFREFVTVNRGTEEGGGVTKLGSGILVMAYAHIAHDCRLDDGVIMANAATLAGHVLVDRMAVIGGLCAIHQFVRIGEFAYIGGMTGVSQDVPPFMLVAGERGWLHNLNLIGLRRRGIDKQTLSALKSAFKMIWRSDMTRTKALEKVTLELGHYPEVRQLVEFVQASERGVLALKNKRN